MVTVATFTTEYFGLKDGSKPTSARNGDKFTEIDTGKIYLYDEEGAQWVQFPPAAE